MLQILQEIYSNGIGYVLAVVHLVVVLFVIAPALKWGSLGFEKQDKLVTLRLPGGALALIPPFPEIVVVYLLRDTNYNAVSVIAAHMLLVRSLLWVPTFVLVAALRLTGHEVDLGCIDNRVDGQFAGESECALHQWACGAFTTLTITGLFPLLVVGVASFTSQGETMLSEVLLRWMWWLPLLFAGAKLFHMAFFARLTDAIMLLTEAIGWAMTSVLFSMKFVLQEASWHVDR